jgi:hypothetical protein
MVTEPIVDKPCNLLQKVTDVQLRMHAVSCAFYAARICCIFSKHLAIQKWGRRIRILSDTISEHHCQHFALAVSGVAKNQFLSEAGSVFPRIIGVDAYIFELRKICRIRS